MPNAFRLPVAEARELCIRAYTRNGVPPADAAIATEQFIICDLLGIYTHGTRRLSHYIGRIEAGGINPTPNIRVMSKAPSMAVVDGDGGLGTLVASAALTEGIRRAKECGITFVGCIDSNHFGANAGYGWLACQEGLICISASNSTPTMPPTGGRAAVVGNNPFGICAPRRDGAHFLLDFALSVTSRAKLRRAKEKGEPIAEGLGLDGEGRPTTDPAAALSGFVLPVGGHKGYGLALSTEILAGILCGGGFGPSIRSQFTDPDQRSNLSHYFILIDPDKTVGRATFERTFEEYAAWLRASPAADPKVPVRVPGERAAVCYRENSAHGIPMDEAQHRQLIGLADGTLRGVVPDA